MDKLLIAAQLCVFVAIQTPVFWAYSLHPPSDFWVFIASIITGISNIAFLLRKEIDASLNRHNK
ncbi:MAG: hypothetical protein ACXWAT_00300 [Methylobacter sp.]